MFLLKIYLAISVLCLGTIIGCRMVFADRLRRFKGEKKKGRIAGWIKFIASSFIPIVNVMVAAGVIYLCFCSDEAAEDLNERVGKEEDEA